jgi:uncharacterized protein (TIRG00374 family)
MSLVNKRLLINILKYLLAFGLLAYVVTTNWDPPKGRGLKHVWHAHFVEGQPVHYDYLAIAFVLFLASILMTFVRWLYLVRALELPFRPGDALRLGAIGYFFNTFLPGSVGGDIVKAAFLAREHPERRTRAVATVLIDRAIALWALIGFVAVLGGGFWLGGLLTGAAERQSKAIVTAAAVIAGSLLAVWALLGFLPAWRAERFAGRLLRLPRIGTAFSEFWRAIWMYRCRQKSVALAVVMSWIGHVGFVLTFYFCALTLWDENDPQQKIPTLVEHFLIVPIGLVIGAVPLFPGGAGIGELGFQGLYKWLGCSESNGVLGSLVQRVLSWVIGLLGFGVYLRMKPALLAAEQESGIQQSLTAEIDGSNHHGNSKLSTDDRGSQSLPHRGPAV